MGKEYEGTLVFASKGIFYDDALPGGKIQVEPWSSQEERLILSPNVDYETTLDRLVKRCTDCSIPPEDLLLSDRQQLFFFMRNLSYGGDYRCSFRCKECSATNTEVINLEDKLKTINVDDPEFLLDAGYDSVDQVTEPFTLELEKLGVIVEWNQLRGKDERAVESYVKKQRKKKRGTKEREDYIYRLALRISSVDGEAVDILEAVRLVESMKGKDILAFRRAVEKMSIGLDPEIELTCECGFENEIILPMDKSFFLPPG